MSGHCECCGEQVCECSELARTERALAALDAMASTWAARVGLREAVRAILYAPDCEDRLVKFIKQAHVEGLYEGRTSLSINDAAGGNPGDSGKACDG